MQTARFISDILCAPLLKQRFLVLLNVALSGIYAQFVQFRKNQTERHAVFAKPSDKLQIDSLRSMARVDEYKKIGHLLARQDVAANHSLQPIARIFAASGIAIAGEVDDVPTVVDDEMIDEHRLAGRRRRGGKAFARSEHIDKAAFAHIASPDKGIFWTVALGTLCHGTVADEKVGRFDLHRLSVSQIELVRIHRKAFFLTADGKVKSNTLTLRAITIKKELKDG